MVVRDIETIIKKNSVTSHKYQHQRFTHRKQMNDAIQAVYLSLPEIPLSYLQLEKIGMVFVEIFMQGRFDDSKVYACR